VSEREVKLTIGTEESDTFEEDRELMTANIPLFFVLASGND
jgi:hypothetical protein